MKGKICTMIGIIGSVIASWFGGWDTGLATLIVFMAIGTTYIRDTVVIGCG